MTLPVRIMPRLLLPSIWTALLVWSTAGTIWSTHAATPQSGFESANRLYEEKRFDEAAKAYEALVRQGTVSGPILFNLGNAYLRSDQIGKAIHAYFQARTLSPRDPDIQTNLKLALSHIPPSPYKAAVRQPGWLPGLTFNEWTILAMGFLVLWSTLAALDQWSAFAQFQIHRWMRISRFIAALLGLGVASDAYQRFGTDLAVVTQPATAVRYGPVKASESFATLPDGAAVAIADQKDDWLQIRTPSDQSGWVPSTHILRLNRFVRNPNNHQQNDAL